MARNSLFAPAHFAPRKLTNLPQGPLYYRAHALRSKKGRRVMTWNSFEVIDGQVHQVHDRAPLSAIIADAKAEGLEVAHVQ